MFSTVLSAAVFGVESRQISVEADVGDGLPSFNMVGFLSAQVKEAQERVRTALKNAGFRMEPRRITVNLSPADLRKSGTGFDLPIAVAVAAAYGRIAQENLQGILIAGELSLNGEVLGVPGILPIVAGAARDGCRICVIPKENEREGAAVSGISVVGVRTLKETIAYLCGQLAIAPSGSRLPEAEEDHGNEEDFADINGQEIARRAAEVAVSGFHNLLMVGPPGAGKSMIARRIPGILPSLSLEESMEITKIYSVTGLLSEETSLIRKRPFRSPHHTVTAKAMSGGGMFPKPGEVSLAHNGVLFLDELPEFSREALEVLRQPLEEHQVCISRNGAAYCFPAHFMLVAAMNPCPCGYYPDYERCTCTQPAVRRYLNRISAPLLDRIDITVEVAAVPYQMLERDGQNETTAAIRARVERARGVQKERYRDTAFQSNAELSPQGIRAFCQLGKEEKRLMKDAFERLDLSARTYYRILKVARTIADMDGSERICEPHLQEALCYRSINRKYWSGR